MSNIKKDAKLWAAVKTNRIKTIKDLLSRGAIKIDDSVLSEVDHTLLHESIIYNKFEIFRLAMVYNANVN